MRSVVVVVGVAMVFVVSASPLPEIFHNYIALYRNSLPCQTQSNLGENGKDATSWNCSLQRVPSSEMISQRKIAEFLGYPHPPLLLHTHNQKTCYWNKRISSKPQPLLWFETFPSTIHKFTNDFDEKIDAVNCQSASPISQFSIFIIVAFNFLCWEIFNRTGWFSLLCILSVSDRFNFVWYYCLES